MIPQTQRQTQSLANPGFGQLWRWLESLIPKQDQRVKFSQGRVEWLGVGITIFINICSKDILSQSHYITSLSNSPDSLPTNSHIKTRGWRPIKVYHINWSLSHTVKQTAMCFAWLSRIHNLQRHPVFGMIFCVVWCDTNHLSFMHHLTTLHILCF